MAKTITLMYQETVYPGMSLRNTLVSVFQGLGENVERAVAEQRIALPLQGSVKVAVVLDGHGNDALRAVYHIRSES